MCPKTKNPTGFLLFVFGLLAVSCLNVHAQVWSPSAVSLKANPDPASDIRISLQADKPFPKAGDEITLTVAADRDCYLTVLYIGPSGTVTVFWPNRSSGWDNRVVANRPIQIPGPAADFKFKIDGKQSVENIVAYATTQKGSVFSEQDFRQDPGSRVRTFSGNARDFEHLFRQRTVQLPRHVAWGVAHATIRVASGVPGSGDGNWNQDPNLDNCQMQVVLREVAARPGAATAVASKNLDEKSLRELEHQLVSDCHEGTLGTGEIEYIPGSEMFLDSKGWFKAQHVDALALESYEVDLPKTVCGKDERVRRSPCNDAPWRWNCYLFIHWPNGGRGLCTGWLIGPRTVMTAGHCLYSHKLKAWATKVEVAPGADGSSLPFGAQASSDLRSVDRWVHKGDGNFDFGAIILPTGEFGEKLGFFGFQSLATDSLKKATINTAGYPGDKPRGTQWFAAGPVQEVSCGQIKYMMDTYGGQSGSPVWAKVNDKRTAVAIHTQGGCPNKATRIRKPIFDMMMHWKKQ